MEDGGSLAGKLSSMVLSYASSLDSSSGLCFLGSASSSPRRFSFRNSSFRDSWVIVASVKFRSVGLDGKRGKGVTPKGEKRERSGRPRDYKRMEANVTKLTPGFQSAK